MDISPDDRQRLDAAMEARAEALDMTWREVAAAAGLSYETVRAVRRGTGNIPGRTRRKIERGLRWPRLVVDRYLDDPNYVISEESSEVKRVDPAFRALMDVHRVYVREYGLEKADEMLRADVDEINAARERGSPPGAERSDTG